MGEPMNIAAPAFILSNPWRTVAVCLLLALACCGVFAGCEKRRADDGQRMIGRMSAEIADREADIEAQAGSIYVLKLAVAEQNAALDSLQAAGGRSTARVQTAVQAAQTTRRQTAEVIERLRDVPPPTGRTDADAAEAVRWGRAGLSAIDSILAAP